MKFFLSVFFNIILAVIAAVLFVIQEIWLGTAATLGGMIGLGVLASVGFSFIAEMIKVLFISNEESRIFNMKQVLIGVVFGVAAAIATALLAI